MKSFDQQLFDKAFSLGDGYMDDSIHIIDITELPKAWEGDFKFRIYHKAGYCWEISKEALAFNKTETKCTKYEYSFHEYWDGFFECKSSKEALRLLKLTNS